MSDHFSTLGVGEDADDDQIKQRYLSLVRRFRLTASRNVSRPIGPPTRRCATSENGSKPKLLGTRDAALGRIKSHLLPPSKPVCARASKTTVTALLIDGIDRACGQDGTA